MGRFKVSPHSQPTLRASAPPPPSAHDDTQTHRKGADKAWPTEGRRKAELKSLAEGLTHRFFTSCAVRERGSGTPASNESGCSPSEMIEAPGAALGLLGRKSWVARHWVLILPPPTTSQLCEPWSSRLPSRGLGFLICEMGSMEPLLKAVVTTP